MDIFDQTSFAHRVVKADREEFHILRDKVSMPLPEKLIDRPRLNSILKKSQHQFPATLITGRAGTGKTALAASFAAQKKKVSWYSVGSTDIAWPVFSNYLSASLIGTEGRPPVKTASTASQNEIARFLVTHFSRTQARDGSLIVLDDIHHIFDAYWFEDFFNLLLYSLQPEAHLILLCRSKPPAPLWRLRSKQMLNVLDEKVIAFNLAETEALFRALGLSASHAADAHRECFGRVSKMLQFAKH